MKYLICANYWGMKYLISAFNLLLFTNTRGKKHLQFEKNYIANVFIYFLKLCMASRASICNLHNSGCKKDYEGSLLPPFLLFLNINIKYIFPALCR